MFYAIIAHAKLLYGMLDTCGLTDAICRGGISLENRIGISQDSAASGQETQPAVASHYHVGNVIGEDTTAFPTVQEDTRASPSYSQISIPTPSPSPKTSASALQAAFYPPAPTAPREPVPVTTGGKPDIPRRTAQVKKLARHPRGPWAELP